MQIFDLFDVKRKGVIDFGDFVRSLNVFHPNAPEEDKIDCKFCRYDAIISDYIDCMFLILIASWMSSKDQVY